MTKLGSHECLECGRTRWSVDHFCPNCGTRFDTEGSSAASAEVHELEPDSLTEGDTRDSEPQTGSPRETLLGIAVLALVIAAFAGIFVFGGDEQTSVDDTTPLVAPTPTSPADRSASTQSVVPAATPLPSTALALPTTPATPASTPATPGSTPVALRDVGQVPTERGTAVDRTSELAARGRLLADLGLGTGWLATVNGRSGSAFNLTTGEVVSAAGGEVDPFGSILTPQGIYSPSFDLIDQRPGAAFEQQWEFVPWFGTKTKAVDLPGVPIHAYLDDQVGPVAIVSVSGADQRVESLHALALESGESQQIDIDVDIWLMQVGFRFAAFLQRPGHGFLIEDGSLIHQWTWADGWTEHTNGRAITRSGDSLVVARCPGPQTCSFELVDGNGNDVASLDNIDEGLSILGTNLAVSRDLSTIAIAINDTTGAPDGEILLVDTTTDERRRIDSVGATWSMLWTPNDKYLLLRGSSGTLALEAATGQITNLPFIDGGPGLPLLFFFDELTEVSR